MGHPPAEYATSHSLEAVMPTSDPLFLLGYTIIIYMSSFCVLANPPLSVFFVMRCVYAVDTNSIILLQLYNIKISNNILK
jgi:hypothetical protein